MRHKWTQLHSHDWPELIDKNTAKEVWRHQIGYLLILDKIYLPKKRWFLVNHATNEILLDMTFASTKKHAPIKDANEILSKRLFGMKI